MRKLKIPILLLANLVLLMAFALLPKLVSQALDMQIEQNPVYSDMQSVQLDLIAEERSLSDLDKLSLLSGASAMDIQADQMHMTVEQVEEYLSLHLARLDALGLCSPFDPSTYSLQPKLMYDLFNASNNFTLWFVSFVSPEVTLRMDVDDETGNILSISYFRKESFSMDGVWERNHTTAEALEEFFFSQFGLLETAQELCFADYREVDGGVSEVYYRFSGYTQKDFQIQFNVDGAGGFTVSFFS